MPGLHNSRRFYDYEVLGGYVFRHRYLKPDIVIVHEGGNDVMAMLFDHYNPAYTHLRAHGTRPVAGPFDRAMPRWAAGRRKFSTRITGIC